MKKNKIVSYYAVVIVMLFILSFSISIPLIFRGFYYLELNWLDIPSTSGFSYETCKIAFDEMMDYCMGLTSTFSTGSLAFSQEGMSHFTDCRTLFILDLVLLAFSTISLIVLLVLKRKKLIDFIYFNNHSVFYNGAICLLCLFVCIAFVAAMDFDKAFEVFHMIFFPGKDNWIFDWRKDQIINILPEEFFMHCGILIVSVLFIITLTIIIIEKVKTKKLIDKNDKETVGLS